MMKDDDGIRISLRAISRGVVRLSPPPPFSGMLFDLGLFLKLGVGGSLTQEDLLGDQTRRHRRNFSQSASTQKNSRATRLF